MLITAVAKDPRKAPAGATRRLRLPSTYGQLRSVLTR